MIILGIDPGTARTGYAFVKYTKNSASVLDAGIVATNKDTEMHKRLEILHQELARLCKVFKPKEMIIERLFFNTNVKTAMTVGQARGVSLLVAAQFNMRITEYTALQAKMCLTGYGRAQKDEIQQAVKEYFELEEILKPDDASDAAAMVICRLKKGTEL